MNTREPKFKHYHMCRQCASNLGGILPADGGAITVMQGTCKYCEAENVTLIPWVDFNWPKEKSLDSLAKVSRD